MLMEAVFPGLGACKAGLGFCRRGGIRQSSVLVCIFLCGCFSRTAMPPDSSHRAKRDHREQRLVPSAGRAPLKLTINPVLKPHRETSLSVRPPCNPRSPLRTRFPLWLLFQNDHATGFKPQSAQRSPRKASCSINQARPAEIDRQSRSQAAPGILPVSSSAMQSAFCSENSFSSVAGFPRDDSATGFKPQRF